MNFKKNILLTEEIKSDDIDMLIETSFTSLHLRYDACNHLDKLLHPDLKGKIKRLNIRDKCDWSILEEISWSL